jgi:hypothetical protein
MLSSGQDAAEYFMPVIVTHLAHATKLHENTSANIQFILAVMAKAYVGGLCYSATPSGRQGRKLRTENKQAARVAQHPT